MIWNCQVVGNKIFSNTLSELLRRYDPTILALVEIQISGTHAEDVCRRLKFEGNFNETKNMEERFNCSEDLARRCNNFNLWIENTHLLDLDFTRPRFTWARGNSVETKKYARLDRGLCNEQWRVRFAEANIHHLLQNKLDHSPLLISLMALLLYKLSCDPSDFKLHGCHIILLMSA
ncbi:hypothetical protein Cgig2_005882 [Carnegiea gigantea]|uniref:Uncharacterized protein n=1 Tax=Carnegiea gigantea TaxID=171969 RepID=A0A9Q1KKX8_9CARY|nr:hypothetical protein Cgig2_005882 [Carnegiea gigantea]